MNPATYASNDITDQRCFCRRLPNNIVNAMTAKGSNKGVVNFYVPLPYFTTVPF
jgi:hypothetical protein